MAHPSARAVRVSLALLALALSAAAPMAHAHQVPRGLGTSGDLPTPYSVALEQCVSSSAQADRSVTFVAQMSATSSTQKMSLRIDLEQRLRGEAEYHTILAPGLGVWRNSETGVKIYKYVKQITNLTAPAAYRALVHFRWVGDKGKVVKRAEARSSRCFQPSLTSPLTPAPAS